MKIMQYHSENSAIPDALCQNRITQFLNRKFLFATSVLLAILMFSSPAIAADLNVGNAGGETYDVTGTEAYDTVAVGTGNTTGTINIGAGDTLSSLQDNYIGAWGGNATVNIASGGILRSLNNVWLGIDDNSTGDVTVSGAGSAWEITWSLGVGTNGHSNGSLTIADGGYVSANLMAIGAAPWAWSGTPTGLGNGELLVTGAGSTLEVFSGIDMGRTAKSPGSAVISDGATVNVGVNGSGFYIGPGGTLTVTGDTTTLSIISAANTAWLHMGGSTGEFTDGATVRSDGGYIGGGGDSPDTTTLTIDGEGTTWDATVRIYVGGVSGGAGTGIGVLNVTDGAKVTSATIGAGLDTDSTGTINISGEGSSITAAANPALPALGNVFIGYAGAGNMIVSDSASLSAANRINIASVAGSTGALNIGGEYGSDAKAAGTITTPNILFGAGTGALVLNHTEDGYVLNSNVTGNGSVGLYSGTTSFSGDLTQFTGTMTVDDATLFIADGDTLTLGGNYLQTSTGVLKIGTSSDNSYGSLVVAGTATFDDNATIIIDVDDLNSLAAGDVLANAVTAGTLNATTIKLTDNSELFSFYLTPVGNTMDINIVRGTSVVNSVSDVSFRAGLGAASVWDDIIDLGKTNTDIDEVVTVLGRMNSSREVSSAIAETLPLLVGGTTEVAAKNMGAINQVIISRQLSLNDNSYKGSSETNKGLWISPVGNWAKQGTDDGISGYDLNSYGFVAGADGKLSTKTSLGLAFSFMKSDVDGKDSASGNHVDIDAFQLIAYGSRSLGSNSDAEAYWQLDAGINNNDASRNINFMQRAASATYKSYTAHAGTGIGREIKISDTASFTPGLRADYTYVKDESYTETGADSLNLNVKSNDSEDMIVMAKGTFAQSLGKKLMFNANAGIGYDFLNSRNTVTASYSGGGSSFETKGIEQAAWVGQSGLGLAVKTSENTQLSAGYDVIKRGDFLSQTASLNLLMLF
jgi:outer membrane autotransporter protein